MQKEWKRLAPLAIADATRATAENWLWQKTKAGLPDGAIYAQSFAIAHDAGRWYGIARFDDRFKKGFQNVVAHYSLNPDGLIEVLSSVQDSFSKKWEERTGRTKFVDNKPAGRLKVSVFGPFYIAYTIIALNDDDQYILIASNDREYVWLLSRNPDRSENVKRDYLQPATIDYDSSRFIWTKQTINHA